MHKSLIRYSNFHFDESINPIARLIFPERLHWALHNFHDSESLLQASGNISKFNNDKVEGVGLGSSYKIYLHIDEVIDKLEKLKHKEDINKLEKLEHKRASRFLESIE